MMYSLFPSSGALIAFLLGTASAMPQAGTASSANIAEKLPPSQTTLSVLATPTADIGLGYLTLRDRSKTNPQPGCHVEFRGIDIFGCTHAIDPVIAVTRSGTCEEPRGRHYIDIDYDKPSDPKEWRTHCGTLIVEFAQTPTGPTYIHYQSYNGTIVGCTIPDGKSDGSTCFNNQLGSGIALFPQYGESSPIDHNLQYVFTGGWCVAKITQHQKAHPGNPIDDPNAQYSFDVQIIDSNKGLIADTSSGVFPNQKHQVEEGKELEIYSQYLTGKFNIIPGSKSFCTKYRNPTEYC